MKNYDALLEVAELVCNTYRGTATGGTTTTVTEDQLVIKTGEYNNGTIFIHSGTYAGSVRRITSNAEGTITFTPALAGAVLTGVNFTLADAAKFTLEKMKAAINHSLRDYDVAAIDETLLYDPEEDYIALPTGVTDVRTVEIANNATTPLDYMKIYGWKEEAGNLFIYSGCYNDDEDHTLKLTYIKKAGEYADTAEWDEGVYMPRVKWEAISFLYRDLYSKVEKDNPILQDLLAQAIDKATKERTKGSYTKPLPQRSVRTSGWS